MLGSLNRSLSRNKRRAERQNANRHEDGQGDAGAKEVRSLTSFVDERKESHTRDDGDDRGDDSMEYPHHHPHNALIYSAPTVDSLGDESTLIRPYPTPRTQQYNHPPSTSSSRPPMDIPLSASLLRTPTADQDR